MKHLYFLLILIFCYNSAISQNLVIPDKKWEGAYLGNPDNTFQSKFRSSKKTIDGFDYYELMYKVDDGWFEGVQQYYRQEGNKVYRLCQGEEKPLYDFGLSVGDTIEITDDFGGVYNFFPIRTVDTLIFDITLRKLEMRVKPKGEAVSNVPHVWLEGIGDVGFFFGNGFVFGNINSSPLFCVREMTPVFSAGMGCPNILSSNIAESITPDFQYDFYSKEIHIKNEKIKSLELYTIDGRRLKSLQLTKENRTVDLSFVNEKLCVVVLSDGNSHSSKILKL